MKRVNVFIDGETYTDLGKISKELQKSNPEVPGCYSVTRSDLIRFALHYTYKLKFPVVHVWGDQLERALKQRGLID